MKDTTPVCVLELSASNPSKKKAEALAERLHLQLKKTASSDYKYHLVYTDNRLELQHNPLYQKSKPRPFSIDFLQKDRIINRLKTSTTRDPLARAVGIKAGFRPSVADATAGLGFDGMTLAWLGCKVVLIERSTIIFALLEDGIKRACENPTLRDIIERNIILVNGNSHDILPTLSPPPNTVYLDPMYPVQDKRALNKIEMRILRHIVGDDYDCSKLFHSAYHAAGTRIAVKRPKEASRIIRGIHVNHSISMKSGRFDVYIKNHL